jgi:hypothetical protein
MCQIIYKYHMLDHYNFKFHQSHPFCVLDGQIGLGKGVQKGWQRDNILVLLKEFGPDYQNLFKKFSLVSMLSHHISIESFTH